MVYRLIRKISNRAAKLIYMTPSHNTTSDIKLDSSSTTESSRGESLSVHRKPQTPTNKRRRTDRDPSSEERKNKGGMPHDCNSADGTRAGLCDQWGNRCAWLEPLIGMGIGQRHGHVMAANRSGVRKTLLVVSGVARGINKGTRWWLHGVGIWLRQIWR